MILKRENITGREWNSVLKEIRKLTERVSQIYGDSFGNPLMSDDGLYQIPITNKEWASWVGYEHEEQTLWFKPIFRKHPSGFLTKCPYGPPSLQALAKSIIWNTALYIHFFNKPVANRAIHRAVWQSLQDSSCPMDLRESVMETTAGLCIAILSSVSDAKGTINRCAIQLLKDDLDTKLGSRTCTNRNLRRNLCHQLIIQGIATLKTRTLQQNMLRTAVKGENRLKGSAVKSIERMLTTDEKLLKLNYGVSILLPYTPKEISKLRSSSRSLAEKDHIADRVNTIKEKIHNCMTLAGADRKFKSKYKDLFR